eukprot:CFRG1674T1
MQHLVVDEDLLVSDPTDSPEEQSSIQLRNNSIGVPWQQVYVAVGTNLGNRHNNIYAACTFLQNLSTSIIQTSFLYSTPAAYVTDQPSFLNIVVSLTTDLKPLELLDELKKGEVELGRVPSLRWGPRHIDLDILTYGIGLTGNIEDGLQMDTERLTIPHPRMFEREFVLRPLCDLDPNFWPYLEAIRECWDPSVTRVLGLPRDRDLPYGKTTQLMGILNATPDSFTDGGELGEGADAALTKVNDWVGDNVSATVAATEGVITSGLNEDVNVRGSKHTVRKWTAIVDVGGQSTRPGAQKVSPDEEMRRVLPIIQALRLRHPSLVISVDTSVASVAKAAIRAGADIINDVTAGDGDSEMLDVAVELQVPIVLMHSRGNPSSMNSLSTYKQDGVAQGVRHELGQVLRNALSAGVRRWNIILDPGVGFAKIGMQNVQLMRALPTLFAGELQGHAILVGPSRKRFLSTIAGHTDETPASDRDWGTAAAVSQCVAAKVDFVRVHNVRAMADVVANANAFQRDMPIVPQ